MRTPQSNFDCHLCQGSQQRTQLLLRVPCCVRLVCSQQAREAVNDLLQCIAQVSLQMHPCSSESSRLTPMPGWSKQAFAIPALNGQLPYDGCMLPHLLQPAHVRESDAAQLPQPGTRLRTGFQLCSKLFEQLPHICIHVAQHILCQLMCFWSGIKDCHCDPKNLGVMATLLHAGQHDMYLHSG